MKALYSVLRDFSTHTPSRTIGLVFGVMSFLIGQWIIKIPEVKQQLGLSEGELGLALLGMPLGTFVVMPVVGWVITRFGAGKATFLATLFFSVAVMLPGFCYKLLDVGRAIGIGRCGRSHDGYFHECRSCIG